MVVLGVVLFVCSICGIIIATFKGIMIRNSIFSKTSIPVLSKSMNASMMRSKVIANNIANATTPGFKRGEVTFEKELRRAIDKSRIKGVRTNPKHMSIGRKNLSKVKPNFYVPNDPTLPGGVNNVDIDMENAKMAENQLLYNFSVRAIKERINMLDSSIKSKSQNIHQ